MSQSPVELELAGFATSLVENAGGMMEWLPSMIVRFAKPNSH